MNQLCLRIVIKLLPYKTGNFGTINSSGCRETAFCPVVHFILSHPVHTCRHIYIRSCIRTCLHVFIHT